MSKQKEKKIRGDREDVGDFWGRVRFLIQGKRWFVKPFWYLARGDDSKKGARCAVCGAWVKRKNRYSLQIHEMSHWD